MSTPFIIWSIVAGLFVAVVLVRLVSAFLFCAKGRHRVITFGSEREEFFIPGDPMREDVDNDFEEFIDL